jgi:hypothetical protein
MIHVLTRITSEEDPPASGLFHFFGGQNGGQTLILHKNSPQDLSCGHENSPELGAFLLGGDGEARTPDLFDVRESNIYYTLVTNSVHTARI